MLLSVSMNTGDVQNKGRALSHCKNNKFSSLYSRFAFGEYCSVCMSELRSLFFQGILYKQLNSEILKWFRRIF